MVRFSKTARFGLLLGLFFSLVVSTGFGITNSAVALLPSPQATDLSLTAGVEKTVLDNGLTVLTKEIHTAPVVSVQVWYQVGSRNEPEGANGISHQLEHLMFKGTSDRPIQFGRLFSALGSQFNAFTGYDQTAYYNTVEQDKLNALLVLEADRMKNALINEEQLASEKRVVISELQGYENNPDYRLGRAVMRAAFPEQPYGLPIGGTKADVEKFTVEQVRQYYQTYYSPDNATLVITGDFNTDDVLATVRETFGALTPTHGGTPRTATPASPQAPTTQPNNSEPIVLREPGSSAILNAVYPLPNINHPDVPAIDLMDLILTQGRSSRLYQALVESGLASSMGAYASELIDPGWYDITVTASPQQSLAQVDQALLQSLEQLRQQPVSPDELARAKTQLKSYIVLSNQDVTNQASQLAYNQVVSGDYRYSDRYLAAIEQVTVDDIQRVAQTYLDPALRTVGYFEPTTPDGQGDQAAAGTSRTVENFSPGEPVDPAEVAQYLPPVNATPSSTVQPLPEVWQLDNGLTVLLLPDDSAPVVNLSGWVDAGLVYDTPAKAGTASLTAANLLSGTKNRTALELAEVLEDEGLSLDFTIGREGVSIAGAGLSSSLPTLVDVLSDVLQQANFPRDQLRLSRQRSLLDVQDELNTPERLSWRLLRQSVYPPEHPFHVFATEDSLKAVTRSDVRQFYATHYRPDTVVLSLVGDFEPDALKSLLQSKLGDWQAEGAAPELTYPPVSLPDDNQRVQQTIPGTSEAVTYMGYNGIDRQDPRFYAAMVLNDIVGGGTLSSRLGTEVRDRQGLTYGIYSFFLAGIHPGPFAIGMQTAPEDTDQAVNLTIAVLNQLQEQGITETELETAKRSLISSYTVSLASPDTIAAEALNNRVYGVGVEELREFSEQIEAVTLADVQQVIKDLVHPNSLVIVTTGPGNGTPSD